MPSLIDRVSTKSTMSKEYKCTVQLLDDTQTMTVDFKKHDLGQAILDYICDMMNVVEKDYFGLRYVDSNRHRYWLDTTKPILRQVKGSSIVFAFRVKFYPSDPTIVKEELTRYLIALQLKRDLLHGRLYCPQSDAAALGAYILQGEIGDYDPRENTGNYVSQYKLFLNQTPKLEEKIALEHQKLKGKGLSPADADIQFLKKACTLDTYGYYPYTIKEPKAGQVYMGATPHGVLVYQTHRKLHHIKWDDINGFDYDGKDFFIYPKPEYFDENNIEKNGTKKKPSLKFNCPSATFCKHLWKYMLAQQAFFTKFRSNEVKPVAIRRGPLFRRATFRYAGRVLQEIKEAPSPKRAEPSFERSHLQRQMPRDERNAPWANKFHTLPRATKPVPEVSEYQSALTAVSKEAPERTVARDSLALDTTAQATPIITPVSGLSPASAVNGLSAHDTSVTTGATATPDDSFVVNRLITTTTTSSTAGGAAYKQDVVTVSLKHVQQLEDEITKAVKNFEQENQRPLSTSTPVADREKQKEITSIIKEKREVIEDVIIKPAVAALPTSPPTAPAKVTTTPAVVKASPVPELKTPVVAPVVQPVRREGGGLARALIKTVLSGVMFTILLIGTVIVIMEIQDPQFRQYLRHVPGEDTFRHHYYDPTRQRALEWYERASGRQEEDFSE